MTDTLLSTLSSSTSGCKPASYLHNFTMHANKYADEPETTSGVASVFYFRFISRVNTLFCNVYTRFCSDGVKAVRNNSVANSFCGGCEYVPVCYLISAARHFDNQLCALARPRVSTHVLFTVSRC